MTVLTVSTSKENFKGAVLCVTGMGLFIATERHRHTAPSYLCNTQILVTHKYWCPSEASQLLQDGVDLAKDQRSQCHIGSPGAS